MVVKRSAETTQVITVAGASTSSTSTATRATTATTARVDADGTVVTSATPTGVPTTLVAASPPPPNTGRGAIFGYVYQSCGQTGVGGNAGACQSQTGVPGVAMVAQSGGHEVARTQTAADGSYRLEVASGSYVVQETRDGQTATLRVETGRTVVANFTLT